MYRARYAFLNDCASRICRVSTNPIAWFGLAVVCAHATAGAAYVRLSGFSYDDRELLVDYCDVKRCTAGSIDLKTQSLTLLEPDDASHVFNSPAARDSQSLIVTIKSVGEASITVSQIGLIDLRQKQYRTITTSNTFKDFPSPAQDSTKVVFAQANRERQFGKTRFSKWDIYEVDLQSGIERRRTDFCFFLVSKPQYLMHSSVLLFSGEPTCNFPDRGSPDSYKAYKKRYAQNTIFRITPEHQELAPFIVRGGHSNTPIASRDGLKILFVSRTNDLDRVQGNYNYDLFLHEANKITRLTRLRTLLTDVAFSNDGNIAAYKSDPARDRNDQLWLFDLRTSTHRRIDINEHAVRVQIRGVRSR